MVGFKELVNNTNKKILAGRENNLNFVAKKEEEEKEEGVDKAICLTKDTTAPPVGFYWLTNPRLVRSMVM